MTTDYLVKMVEHNNWANRGMVRACIALSDEQLDATPFAGQWSIRRNLTHLVKWQQEYVWLMTSPPKERPAGAAALADLESSAGKTGDDLLALARGEHAGQRTGPVETSDGYRVEPWVPMVQALNHATEHRKQIAGLMRALDVKPPWQDGWAYGEATGALVKLPE
jgi:uncharacterized damage-inducible protein DinB